MASFSSSMVIKNTPPFQCSVFGKICYISTRKSGDITSLYSNITLQTATNVSTLDAIKAHILSLHNNMSNSETRMDYINVTDEYTDSCFIKQTRYWGAFARISSQQGSITYSSRNGDMVVVGVTNISTTPVWNVIQSNRNTTDSTETIDFDAEARFFVYTNTTSSTGTKPVSSNNGYLFTFVRADATRLQIFREASTSSKRVYLRTSYTNGWGDWMYMTLT